MDNVKTAYYSRIGGQIMLVLSVVSLVAFDASISDAASMFAFGFVLLVYAHLLKIEGALDIKEPAKEKKS